jgi:DNA-binding transcriptional MerR regulator
MTAQLSPSQAAEQTGLSVHTLRWYERQGLISSIARAGSGHRRYAEGDIDWIRMLQCLRKTAMPVRVMHRFAELTRGGRATIPERLRLLEAHERSVRQQIADLELNLEAVTNKIRYYQGQLDVAPVAEEPCPTDASPIVAGRARGRVAHGPDPAVASGDDAVA